MKKGITTIVRELYLDGQPHTTKEMYDAVDRSFKRSALYNKREGHHQGRAAQQYLKRHGHIVRIGDCLWQAV